MKRTILVTGILVALGLGAGYYLGLDHGYEKDREITTFEECAAAGYPIMESYPEQCLTPDGRNFVRVIDKPIVPPVDTGNGGGNGSGNGGVPVACTMDAMQCPDGSYVGRSGPNCEFVCTVPTSLSGVRGTVMLGPTCPVVQNPPAAECADRPFKTNLVITTQDGAKIVKFFSSDVEGAFSISVSPGFYFISSAPGGPPMPSCAKGEVIEVKANSYTQTTVYCDSGIR